MPFKPSAHVSMREFLRTGKFGPVGIGDAVHELRESFGQPDATGGTSGQRRTPGIWKYGDVEFHLSEDRQRLELIFCDSFQRLHLGSATSLDPWFFEGHPSCEEVERELSAAQISCRREDAAHDPTAYRLCLESGVKLTFSTGADPVIHPGVPGLFGFSMS